MIFDAIASLLFFLTAISAFIIHVLSSPKRAHWIDLPSYVRVGLFLTGAATFYRGINLAILSSEVPPTSPGHINQEALVAAAIIGYVFMAMAYHILRRTFPVRVWNRLKYIESLASCANGGALAILASMGWNVAPPNAPPAAMKQASEIDA